ncbi:MAG: hypothetical protein PHY95_01470 [Candidatus ainarchaeum sp.]|nr:hypothetical protein [Candidatus ainarchaeum sp.]
MPQKGIPGAEGRLAPAANAAQRTPGPRNRAWLAAFLKGQGLGPSARIDACYGLDTFERASRGDPQSMDAMAKISERAASHGAEALKTFISGMCDISVTTRGTGPINEVMAVLSHLLGLAKAAGSSQEDVCGALKAAFSSIKAITKRVKEQISLEKVFEPLYSLQDVPQALGYMEQLASGKTAAPCPGQSPPADARGQLFSMIEKHILAQGKANGAAPHEISGAVLLAREKIAFISESVRDPAVMGGICDAATRLESIFFVSRYLAYMADASQAIGAAIPSEHTLLRQAKAVAQNAARGQLYAEYLISRLAGELEKRTTATS